METVEEKKENKRSEVNRDDTIGKLHRRMYSRARKGFLPWRARRDASIETPVVQSDWQQQEEQQQESVQKRTSYTGASALLIFSAIFFVLAGIGAFVYLQLAVSAVAEGGVDIAIEGSTAIASGDVLELQVLVTNRNADALELADLVVTYPDGTVSPADFRTPLQAERIPLGLVEARSARRGAIRAVILGNNGDLKDISVELQYRVRGSSAIYSRETSHTTLLSTDALSITIEANTELTPGQSVPLIATVKSHSSTILNGVYLDVNFPFGFVMVDTSPQPVSSDKKGARWLLGSLRPGEERRVQLSGTLDGQAGDNRHIKMQAGSGVFAAEATANDDTAYLALATAEHIITVRKPFLAVRLESEGSDLAGHIAHAGEAFDVSVFWQNNLNVPIHDATIAITLGGSALNKAGVNAGQAGFYRSVDSLLLWDAKTSGGLLKNIIPGASGEFKFKITPLPKSYLQQIRTPDLSFAVHAAGKRLSEGKVPEVLKEDSLSTVKIGTDVIFAAYGLYKASPFGARGPLPPKVEYETTYGIVWELSNTTSDLKEAIVKADLPHYVRWVGLTAPANEQLIYNKVNNTLEWHLGTVAAGAGTSAKKRSVSFALGLVPSATQIGQTPELVREQIFEAIDTYTNEVMQEKVNNIDTRITQDNNYDGKESRVIK